MSEPLLSIIVPVYNAAKYLERTVKALLTQDIPDYEIILIDDGSTDGSANICDRLALITSNVISHHFKNAGPGRARNNGIRIARGKYITFCDSDDLPSDNMYGKLLSDMTANQVDLSLCDIYSERDCADLGFPWNGNIRFSGDAVINTFMAAMLGNLSDNDTTLPVWGSSVRCIYRKDIILKHNITFPEDIRFAEDLVFNIRYIARIGSCHVRNEALYHYTFNKESLMNSHVRYNNTCFAERLKLVAYITGEIEQLPNNDALTRRFFTSQRCYFLECVGNAARAISSKGYGYSFHEIRKIVGHPTVRKAFNNFDAKSKKKRLSYSLIKKRLSVILLIYFAIRLRK